MRLKTCQLSSLRRGEFRSKRARTFCGKPRGGNTDFLYCEQWRDGPRYEPLNRDEREDSPPRLGRSKRTTRPPNNYAREQKIDIERRKTRSLQKKAPTEQEERVSATSGDSSTKEENLSVARIVTELEELRKVKEEFSAALVEVRHELQTLTDTYATPQLHPEACSRDSHGEILREIQTVREEVSVPVPMSSPSYASIARTPPLSHPNNMRTPPAVNTRPTTLTETLYCTCIVIFGNPSSLGEYHLEIAQCPICEERSDVTACQVPPTNPPVI
ncbi:hypothetical protein LT330_010694 [Penicillium expansum]|nr:hypothetical protein LT330_010694 [Penicillium expansum]